MEKKAMEKRTVEVVVGKRLEGQLDPKAEVVKGLIQPPRESEVSGRMHWWWVSCWYCGTWNFVSDHYLYFNCGVCGALNSLY